MNSHETFSDEFLNAYIDGELAEAEKARLLEALCHDETLNARVNALQKVRELLQHAYAQQPAIQQNKKTQWRGAAIAAGVMLTVGTLLGWGLHGYQSSDNELLGIAQSMQLTPLSDDGTWRVVLHVTTGDHFRLKTVLDEAESLLKSHTANHQMVEVEILANGRGLDLLRTRTSPYAERIQALQAQYANVAFKACQLAINRVQQEQHINVKLLPAAETVPTAIGRVIQRQQQGWAYVRI